MEKRRHSLDALFPLGLLGLFVLCAVLVILFSASFYRQTLEKTRLGDGETALAYVTEKLHQSDRAGAVSLGAIGDCPAVVITRGQRRLYDTYIYCSDGQLRELMIKRELEPEPEMGRALLPLERFSAEDLGGGLLKISCRDSSGAEYCCYVNIRTMEGG